MLKFVFVYVAIETSIGSIGISPFGIWNMES